MKKLLNAALIISTSLISLVCGAHAVTADIVDSSGGLIAKAPYITSPTNSTYNSAFLFLNVSFQAAIFGNINYSMNYSLNGRKNQTVPLISHYFGFTQQESNYLDGSVALPQLNGGSHKVSIFLECKMFWNASGVYSSRSYFDNQTVYFAISGPDIPVKSWLLSPTNTTYKSNSMLLNVTGTVLSGFTNTYFIYSVDGSELVKVPTTLSWHSPISADVNGNVTVILSNGSHYITVYAYFDSPIFPSADNGTVYFTINDPNPLPIPTPTSTPAPSPTPMATPYPSPTIGPSSTSISTTAPSHSPSSEPSPSQSIEPSPSVPEFPSTLLVSFLMATMMAGVIIHKRKYQNRKFLS